jgi:glycosyltransferase involved in cell wall biosynthesis
MPEQPDRLKDKCDVLVISDDVVGQKMAGPGIRAWELSRVLAREFRVLLAIPDYSPGRPEDPFYQDLPFGLVRYAIDDHRLIQTLGARSQVVLFQGYVLSKFPALKKLSAVLIVDLYVPFVLENIFVHKWKTSNLEDREFIHRRDLRVFLDLLLSGDHFLCASPRQKDLFLGSLLAVNRIHPRRFDESPNLDNLISVVPFGLSPEKESSAGRRSPQGDRFPYPVSDDDVLLLWGGVLSNWYDPLTLIKAFSRAVQKDSRLKLLFLSTSHPNPLLPEFDMAMEAVRLAADLGLKDSRIFFNPGWVDYQDRGAFFARADVGVSIHQTNFETRYAFRTRMLDYLKYELPILCTRGDYFAELVEKKNLGLVVSAENVDELETAILRLAGDPRLRDEMKAQIGLARADFFWEKTAGPLLRFCRRVLSSPPAETRRAGADRFLDLFQARRAGWPRRIVQSRHVWSFLQKLPPRLSIKLKRLWK